MKVITYSIPIIWESFKRYDVEAENLQDAVEIFKKQKPQLMSNSKFVETQEYERFLKELTVASMQSAKYAEIELETLRKLNNLEKDKIKFTLEQLDTLKDSRFFEDTNANFRLKFTILEDQLKQKLNNL